MCLERSERNDNIYEQIEEAYQFVLRHINMSAQINGIVRRDVYELPVRAVREAIINAVTHRSYMDDSCVQVSVYDDRMEVLSPGMLYGGLDLEAALEGKSKCRNAAVSEAFHYMKLIEAWGTGLGRIRNSCREYGLKEPVIDEFGDGFRVVFFRKEMEENQDEIRKSGNPALPDTELFIIKYIRENDQCTTTEIAGLLDITSRRARGILGSLVKKDVLRKVGNARNTIYQAGGNFPHGE